MPGGPVGQIPGLQELLGLIGYLIGHQMHIVQAESVFLINDIRPGTTIAQGFAFQFSFFYDGPPGINWPEIGGRQLGVLVFFIQ